MLEDIRQAQKSIYLESFILTKDPKTREFFNAIKQKAKEGIKVKIILDRLANLWYGSFEKEEFEKSGAEVLLFNRWWFYRSHRKVLVIDEGVGYIGGVNVSGQYAKWIDLHLRMTGIFVKNLLRSFSRVYELAGGKDAEVLKLRKSRKLFEARAKLYKAKSWLIERLPFKSRSDFRKYYRRKCQEANHKIVLATPYFVPHRWLIKSLKAAANRGVKIEVIVPEHTDVLLANIANRAFAKKLKDFAEFFFIPEMNHAKVLLIDDKEGLVGSNNINSRSFNLDLEAAVIFQRKDMVGDLKQILNRWEKTAKPLSAIADYNKWYHWVLGILVSIFQPIL